MAHYIVGTAGHVDHGKSTLIRALTGTETDRLPEEKERGLSIDLGFAALDLGTIQAGIVDVPGHEKFLKNMLAGVGGYDLGLLVVDAQESVMPQTREHVEILTLLHTRGGVVALTKIDTVESEFVDLVEEELSDHLQGSFLEKAPIVRVSGKTGEGLDQLKAILSDELKRIPPRPSDTPFRMPVDRAFVKSGFGTVVTGSVWSGRLAVGDTVEILPLGIEARIRGLQVHGGPVEQVAAGQRAAVNFSGVDPGLLRRGHVLAPPGLLTATDRIDARLDVLDSVPRPVKHRSPIRFYAGTQEKMGRLYLLEAESLTAGGQGLVQIHLQEPTVLQRQDRFVLRESTGQFTLGGGLVLDPVAKPHKRSDEEVLDRLRQREQGGPEAAVVSALRGGVKKAKSLAQELQMDKTELEGLLEVGCREGTIHQLGKWYADGATSRAVTDRLHNLLHRLQEAAPYKVGWRREELLKLLDSDQPKLAEAVVAHELDSGRLQEHYALLSLSGHEARLNKGQQAACQKVLEALDASRFKPPEWKTLKALVGLPDKIWKAVETYLIETQSVKKLSQGLYLSEGLLSEARRLLAQRGDAFTASEARVILDTSRKYVIPLLEFLDQSGFTQRVDDKRVVRA